MRACSVLFGVCNEGYVLEHFWKNEINRFRERKKSPQERLPSIPGRATEEKQINFPAVQTTILRQFAGSQGIGKIRKLTRPNYFGGNYSSVVNDKKRYLLDRKFLYTHGTYFTKDRKCEVCKTTEITRARAESAPDVTYFAGKTLVTLSPPTTRFSMRRVSRAIVTGTR